jgi:hypothetical protein
MGAAGLQIVEVGVDTVAFALESTLKGIHASDIFYITSRVIENNIMLDCYILPATAVDSMQRHQFAMESDVSFMIRLEQLQLQFRVVYTCAVY